MYVVADPAADDAATAGIVQAIRRDRRVAMARCSWAGRWPRTWTRLNTCPSVHRAQWPSWLASR